MCMRGLSEREPLTRFRDGRKREEEKNRRLEESSLSAVRRRRGIREQAKWSQLLSLYIRTYIHTAVHRARDTRRQLPLCFPARCLLLLLLPLPTAAAAASYTQLSSAPFLYSSFSFFVDGKNNEGRRKKEGKEGKEKKGRHRLSIFDRKEGHDNSRSFHCGGGRRTSGRTGSFCLLQKKEEKQQQHS